MNAGQERRRARAAGILSASSNNITHRKQARMSSNRKMLKILSLLQFALSIVVIILAVVAKIGGQAAAGQGQLDAMRPYLDLPAALALSLGIAIQNFPEGAIISMPLRAEGESNGKAFAGGVLSGVVEPIGAVVTILAAQLVIPALPYLLSFAAGAMLYVVVEELIPEMSQGRHSNLGTVFFAVGFSVMMVLDVALG